MNKKDIAFTIIAQNYLPYAVTLANSMKESNPDVEFIIVFADDIDEEVKLYLELNYIQGISIFELCPNKIILDMAFYYEITEYCTAIKPFVINELIKKQVQTITYIDPDIYVFKSLQESVFKYLENNNIVLTPHICSPINDNANPKERDNLKAGTYNLGFISIKNNKVGNDFTKWWMKKCELECFNDSNSGLFVDQKWINLVPGMFEDVFISRNLGLNMAYWNLHERVIINGKVNGNEELVFFHFSGFVKDDIECISKYQDRFTLRTRIDLSEYFINYKNKIENVSKNMIKLSEYKFLRYARGQTISLLARRFYFWNRGILENPFSSIEAEKVFMNNLKASSIVEEIKNTSVNTPDKINKYAKWVNKFMKIILKLIGPNKYASLCKYFGYLSSIQNHTFIMPNKINMNVVDTNRKHLKR